jgi:hypothetical protein
MTFDRIGKAILAIGTESIREGLVGKLVALLLLAVLGGAWWAIFALLSAVKRWSGAGVVLLALTLAGCATTRPCECVWRPDPRVHELEGEIERLQDKVKAWGDLDKLDDAGKAAVKAARRKRSI